MDVHEHCDSAEDRETHVIVVPSVTLGRLSGQYSVPLNQGILVTASPTSFVITSQSHPLKSAPRKLRGVSRKLDINETQEDMPEA